MKLMPWLKMRRIKEQDDKMKANVDAKMNLNLYLSTTAAEDDKNALEEDDRTKLKDKVKETMDWLDSSKC